MKIRIACVVISGLLLSACTSLEGSYAPGCPAYEGDRIVLEDGRFTWDRFTDAIPVDESGNRVDPTPGYPVQGTYREENGLLSLRTDSGKSLEPLRVRRHDGRQYLLKSEQMEKLQNTGAIPECALVLGEE